MDPQILDSCTPRSRRITYKGYHLATTANLRFAGTKRGVKNKPSRLRHRTYRKYLLCGNEGGWKNWMTEVKTHDCRRFSLCSTNTEGKTDGRG